MAGNLVTVATFGRVADAQFAQGALQAAGIKAAITEEDTSPVMGQFVTAASGIKLLVREEDEAAAVKVLDEAFEDKPLSEEELAAQAAAETAEDPDDAAGVTPAAVSDPVADSAARESDARRALLAGCLGWVIPFGHLFAVVMMMNASSGPGELSPSGKRRLSATILVVFVPWLLVVIAVAILVALGQL